MRRVISILLQIAGLLGLPGDIKHWRTFVIPAIVSAIPGLLSYAQNASWWQILLITLFSFGALFVASVYGERWYSKRKLHESTPIAGSQPEEDKNRVNHYGGRLRSNLFAKDRAKIESVGDTFRGPVDENIHAQDDAEIRSEGSNYDATPSENQNE